MPNKNYQRGYRFERRVMSYLQNKGYYCMRPWASKGLYDVLAIPPTDKNNPDFHNYPLMIQCKSNGYVKPSERGELKRVRFLYQGFSLIAYNDNHKIAFKTIEDEKIISIV